MERSWLFSRVSRRHHMTKTAALIRDAGLIACPTVHDEVGYRAIRNMVSIGINKWAALLPVTLPSNVHARPTSTGLKIT